MAVFVVVMAAPVVYAIYLSLFQTRLIGGTAFVGLANYLDALQDPTFHTALLRVIGYLLVQVPVMLVLAAIAALAIDSARLYLSSVFRITIFLPYAVPAVVATLMWGFMYGTRYGLIGNLNDAFGWSLPNPLSASWVIVAIGNIAVWSYVGYNMLILYSALQLISKDLYEAAEIDGAGTFRVIRAIKLPAMRPSLVVCIVFSVIGSFQLFNEPNVLKTLAPNAIASGYTPNMYAYNLAFAGQQSSYAAAIAIVLGIVTVVVAYIVQAVGMRREGTR
ncbi:carbohydrate ABC transporter membrane protein 1, CUT1 family [Ruania alba]|uniref:Carbohydrate ABC transporter membrane protein 1, CUT1 family n=2 Tax=Ruania alba TaxID=648782 RepID=A0A1H5LNC3_9MICO|nr:carbohydrate ABC transporter membrane protein 1, CUT1 family [Ruania alba]